MKIVIMGTGGVGGYYGGLLARSGEDVIFIARGPHFQAIREKGLQIRSVLGDFTVSPARVTDSPHGIGPADLIIVAAKTYHTEEVAELIKPVVGPETVVMPLQNGVDAAERIGAVIGGEHLVGGTTWLSAAIEAPGIIGHYSPFRRIVFGELNGTITSRGQRIYDALSRSGATVELVENIRTILWTKYVFISAISALGCMTRVTSGEYRQIPETRGVLTDAMSEIAAVAHARGIPLETDVVEKTLSFFDASAPGLKPSMQRDVEAGRTSELESMIGYVVRSGEQLGVPTPVMRFAYAVLKPGHMKAQA